MVSNWTASLNKCVFKCWDRMAPGVCLPEMAPSLCRPPLPSSHRSSLLSSLISLIKDIRCSPTVMPLRQQIRQSTHTDLLARQRQTELQVDKGRSCKYKLHEHTHFLPLKCSKIQTHSGRLHVLYVEMQSSLTYKVEVKQLSVLKYCKCAEVGSFDELLLTDELEHVYFG